MEQVKSKSLKINSLITSVVLVTILFIIYTTKVFYDLRSEKIESLKLRLDQRLHILSESLSLPLWNFDMKQMSRQLHSLKNDPAYCGSSIRDNSGNVIIDDPITTDSKNSMIDNRDITFQLGYNFKKIGVVEVCYNLNEVTKAVQKGLYSSILYSLSAILLITIFINISLNKIIKPLDKIRTRISKVTNSRNKITEEELLCYNEIAVISRTFNQMIDDLNTSDESLIKTNQSLEDKVKERTKELNGYKNNLEKLVQERIIELVKEKEKAEKANRMKTEFISNASHEIRTPMHAIISYAKLASEKLPPENDKILKYLENISASANRLLSLVNDLLDISMLETGKAEFKFDKKNISVIIEKSLMEIKALADAKEIIFKTKYNVSSPDIIVDENKMIQVFINIISNAIKFSERGQELKIFVEDDGLQKDNNFIPAIKIRIIDQGQKIPEDELEKIFERFSHSSTPSEEPGTGLGLAISKEIMQTHHGIIKAENNESGAGSTFTIILPR